MEKSDSEILQDWKRLDSENVKKVCDMISSCEVDVLEYLSDIVASLCDVDKDSMMTKGDSVHYVHARWLFWYAYRYITNDTFEQMSRKSESYGKRFSRTGITMSVNKMSSFIASGTVWTKRWALLKRVIKLRDGVMEFDFKQHQIPKDKIFISIPEQFKENVEIKFE